ncbi:MAG: hypothetical protein ACYCZ6_16185 [Polaromonas sp.]
MHEHELISALFLNRISWLNFLGIELLDLGRIWQERWFSDPQWCREGNQQRQEHRGEAIAAIPEYGAS